MRALVADRRYRWAASALVCTIVVLGAPYLPWITPVAGLVATIGIPASMFVAKLRLPGSALPTRLVLSVALSILLLMLVGLAVNTALPLLGDLHPLARLPVALAVLAEDLVLIGWRGAATPGMPRLPRLSSRSAQVIFALMALALVLCVMGSNRLNNGASGVVTMAAFFVVIVAFAVAWARRESLLDGELAAAIYLAALVLLLATSLRGWYITGHDIQREYHVYQLTALTDRWNISNFQDPYNACLSLTILPTVWARMLRIDDAYVFKVVYQAMFAMSAATLFLICRRQFSRTSALLSAVFYIAFPTFSTDMPFITRQETGFTFLAVAVLVLVNHTWSPAARRTWFVVFAIAIVLSHYSTTYLLLIALFYSQVIWRSHQLLGWAVRNRLPRARHSRRTRVVGPAWGRPTAGLLTLAVIGLFAFLWTEPATHTSSQLRLTVTDTIQTLLGRQQAANSSDVSYSLLHAKVLTPAQELEQYKKASLEATKDQRSEYLPTAVVDRYPTPIDDQQNLPLTTVGKLIARSGLSPTTLNTELRSLLAKYYQAAALLGVGLVALSQWRSRRKVATFQREYLCLAAASFVGLAAVVILPDLSAEYGLLRAFQQALLFLAPAIAETTLFFSRAVLRRFSRGVSFTGGLVVLASLSGALPQLTGGFAPDLSLNNRGTYYNDYYLHPQELDAIAWLNDEVRAGAAVQAEVETDRYTSYLVADRSARTTADVYPTLIEAHAYVFMGFATVTHDIASVSIDGNTVSYRYPTGLLDSTKDVVFASDGSRIYR